MLLETSYCPCQEEEYADYDEGDLPFVADHVVEVHTRRYYKKKQEEAKDGHFAVFTGPSIPKTRRGIAIVDENFPDADLVCPTCEQEYVREVAVRSKEAHEKRERQQEADRQEAAFTEDPEAFRYE